jgi:anti-sigma regulatory factor (Ser/Thr protein kinase)
MVRLVSDILDMNKIMTPSGPFHLQQIRVDIRRLVRDAIDVTAPVARAKNIDIKLDVSGIGENFMVVIDGVRLSQVLCNVLANAVKFTSEGEVAVTATLEPSNSSNSGCLEILVKDTGIGMDSYTLERLFTPFEQGTVKGTYGGSGLGLAISRYIITLLGGTVTAGSDGRGCGSTFKICLPVMTSRDPVGSKRKRVKFHESAPSTSADSLESDAPVAGGLSYAGGEVSPRLSPSLARPNGHILLVEDRTRSALQLSPSTFLTFPLLRTQINSTKLCFQRF